MKEHWKERWRKLGWLASGIYLASLVYRIINKMGWLN
tara:strand:- start:165 stop:275 length:111 start_codon:yes stop_codon:yes gene_type:complete